MLVKYCNQVVKAVPLLQKTAGKFEKRVIPIDNQRYRYLRFRAIGNLEVSGFNGNYDGFPYEDFENDTPGFGYKSFIGKRAHLEHNSSLGKYGSIGDLPDAYLNKFVYTDDIPGKQWKSLSGISNFKKRSKILSLPNQRDGAVEVLMRIDSSLVNNSGIDSKVRRGLKDIISAIDQGLTLTCSMGTNCATSICSACGNEAAFASDYCTHLKFRKGTLTVVNANDLRDLLDKDVLRPEWLPHIVASSFDSSEILNGISNKGVAVKIGEINKGLSFFELSVVKTPAYNEAIALEKVAKQTMGNREEYLRGIRKQFGDDVLLDIYSLMQKDGKISKLCEVV